MDSDLETSFADLNTSEMPTTPQADISADDSEYESSSYVSDDESDDDQEQVQAYNWQLDANFEAQLYMSEDQVHSIEQELYMSDSSASSSEEQMYASQPPQVNFEDQLYMSAEQLNNFEQELFASDSEKQEDAAQKPVAPEVNLAQEAEEKHLSCCICIENMKASEAVTKLPCDHLFHSDCIEPWVALRNTCPICRVPVGPWLK